MEHSRKKSLRLMSVVWTIGIRNLLRQKRRNILLGTAIAFGTMILILANAFAHGISDVLFNRIMKFTSGHISIQVLDKGNWTRQVFFDGDTLSGIVRDNVPGITSLQESIGIFCRAIGNGRGDNVVMVGVDLGAAISEKELDEILANFNMIEGDFNNLADTASGRNPVLLSTEKAKYLNVKMGDALRVRYQNVFGQAQAATLTVAGIFRPANIFMSVPIFLELRNLKALLGYGPHDTGPVFITIENPKKNAITYAEKLHSLLMPDLAAFEARCSSADSAAPVTVTGFRSDSAGRANAAAAFRIVRGDTGDVLFSKGLIVSEELAGRLRTSVGDTVRISYKPKYASDSVRVSFAMTSVRADTGLPAGLLLVNDEDFYRILYYTPPVAAPQEVRQSLPGPETAAHTALAPVWFLLERSRTTQDLQKRMREIGTRKYKGVLIDVQTMYESASMVLQLEAALNLITFGAVMILFFIVLIGVINTLRMTIRERTREIGTIRAIGMQKNDVRNSFLVEAGTLGLFSAFAGTAGAFCAMWILSVPTFNLGENPMSMLLVSGHLHFAPTVGATLFFIIFIVSISVATAFFPARRAAKMPAASALRHIE